MYVERYGHVDAWVASTPIADMVAGLQQALPAVIRRRPDGAPQRFLVSLAARLNPGRAITLADPSGTPTADPRPPAASLAGGGGGPPPAA